MEKDTKNETFIAPEERKVMHQLLTFAYQRIGTLASGNAIRPDEAASAMSNVCYFLTKCSQDDVPVVAQQPKDNNHVTSDTEI